MRFQPNVAEFLTKWSVFSWKVEEELTNTLKEEIQNNYGVKIDSTTNANVDNLQIRVSTFSPTKRQWFRSESTQTIEVDSASLLNIWPIATKQSSDLLFIKLRGAT